MSRPPLEVADVVRQHGAAFLARYGHTLSGAQHRALRAIAVCRTVALGGHITQCDHCDHEIQAYNSCRHRCCPKCHGTAQAAWLAAREREVLETPYVHVIFTLPHDLGPLALQNPRQLYGLLFRTVATTLQHTFRTLVPGSTGIFRVAFFSHTCTGHRHPIPGAVPSHWLLFPLHHTCVHVG